VSVDAVSSYLPTPMPQMAGTGTPRGKSPFDAVSSLLGMSAGAIAGQVASGASLDDLASAEGVSHSDLVAAIKAGMPQDLKKSGDADAIAEAIAAQQGMPAQGIGALAGVGGVGDVSGLTGMPSATASSSFGGAVTGTSGVLSGNLTSSQQTMLDSLGSLLDTDPTTLLSNLQGGASLLDLMSDKNVDPSSLADVLQSGLMVDTQA